MINLAKKWDWSTHQPVIKAILKEFHPDLIVELGMGNFSTPILSSQDGRYVGIDNDSEWFNFVTKEYHLEGKDIRLQEIKHPIAYKWNQLTDQEQIDIIMYYQLRQIEFSFDRGKMKFLFVDNHTCARTQAINIMGIAFDIIVYHDCEPAGIPWYSYYFNDQIRVNYDKYELQTPRSWTGCFIKKGIEHNLTKTIEEFLVEYQNQVNCKDIKFVMVPNLPAPNLKSFT